MTHNATLITFVNTFSYYQLLESSCPIERFTTILVDGGLHVKLHNLFHKDKVNRASFDFSSLANDFFMYVQNQKLKIALIGAKPDEITSAAVNVRCAYPNLQIVYCRDGYFLSETDKHRVCNILKETKPDVIVLGMGTPAQEEYAVYLSDNGVSGFIITCGGFLSQTARKTDYYNPLRKKLGLRWLQRAVQFKYIRKRLFIEYPKNTIRYFLEHIMMTFRKTKEISC
jgi:N-acetylglucosaminyldiphosphoundecaprenol N-acetyl-beta-D-mannosaminyltransferase